MEKNEVKWVWVITILLFLANLSKRLLLSPPLL